MEEVVTHRSQRSRCAKRTVRGATTALTALVLLGGALAGPAHADPEDMPCSDTWRFDVEGEPTRERTEIMTFTLDNRADPNHPLDRTETIATGETETFSNSAASEWGIEISAEASFSAFGVGVTASASSAYNSSTSNTMEKSVSVEKGTEFPMSVGPGQGVVYHVGFEKIRATGYYERIRNCESTAQSYLRIGPVTETAPLESKAVWTELLPPLKEKK
ncbi:hypothetical protein GCM10010329_86200 [Streptomyces spiroverticillatus]|uniref:Uncharacterized protein n=1 Tax=Streptomyces finlayi TaxID=67296 RepID=A0A919CGK2_9ACTN|nr:hypothetical protein [Streptomyces finlayi]GHA50992.1 hypothetical protein GCM10010329_86200 [Streptomyces spiroverticillatus]GHD20061.1 hypothetical protein GCM10010334_84260 [Streptomyces finlayi]